ncbi:MAG TPA: nucleotidyl transferase AbiEii/AbiGii toxin family protein [Micromonosporaceae bacterium]|nr:nucleotidyl transferase AbiEii/AbiGii toxin family protein [Micromonosporaceae bacterium]
MSFTPFQHIIAQLTLEAIADLGFALGGGQALHAHGYGDRLSLDLDFYVTRFDQDLFDRGETATLAALRARGYTAQIGHSDTWLRQILVNDPTTGEQVVLDLGQDYRQNPPIVITGLGPVIDLPDAAASKARALNDRRAARDYLDIHALLSQAAWTPARLFTALRDNLRPIITVEEFAADLAAAGNQDPEDYHAYGLTDADITRLAADFTRWAAELRIQDIDAPDTI